MDKKDKTYYMIKIINDFNKNILYCFNILNNITKNNKDILRLKQLFILAKKTDEKSCIDLLWEKIWDNRDHIKNKNKDLFINKDYSQHINNLDGLDNNKELFNNLINLFNKNIDIINKDEEAYIWDILNKLLDNVIEYKILTNFGLEEYKKNILNN